MYQQVTTLALCLVLLAAVAVEAHKKQKGYEYVPPQKVIILPAGPSVTYQWLGHCGPKGKCKKIPMLKRPPFPSFAPPAHPLSAYAPVLTYPAPPAPASYPPIAAEYAPVSYLIIEFQLKLYHKTETAKLEF